MNYEGMIYRPPSEARSLILQVTVGCAHNKCTFCNMYKEKRFHIKPLASIEADLAEARQFYGNRIARIFLADGDALVLGMEKLERILELCHEYFPYAERIAVYGRAGDVLRKTPEELARLRELGLRMVYIGAESGSNQILQMIHKNVTAEELVEACQKLRTAGIASSVTLISNLGGQALLEVHAIASAKLVTAMRPDYLGFLTLMLEPGTPMYEDVRSGKMQLLTPIQVVDEMELFLRNVDSDGTIFRSNHASNYVALGGTLNGDIDRMLEELKQVRQNEWFRRESARRL